MLVRRDRAMLGVLIMLDVGFHAGRLTTVSAADIAERAGLARRGIEPLLQALSRSGLLDSVRGPRGGYRLGRRPREISLSEIVRVGTSDDGGGCEDGSTGPGGPLHDKVVDALWGELEAGLSEQLQAISLETLLRRAEASGLQRPLAEPITFSI